MVVGAGSNQWNGVYNETGSGTGVFVKQQQTGGGSASQSLYSYGGVWRLGVNGHDLAYETEVKSPQPPTTGWQVATSGPGEHGKAPPPHLVAGVR